MKNKPAFPRPVSEDMSRRVRWFFLHTVFSGFLYMAYILEVSQAENVVLFFAWFNIIFSFLMPCDGVQKAMEKKVRSVPSWVNVCVDVSITIVFIWFGAWFTGTFWLFALFVQEYSWDKAEKRIK